MDCLYRSASLTDAEGIANTQVSVWKSTYDGLLPEPLLAAQNVPNQAALVSSFLQRAEHGTIVGLYNDQIVGFASWGAVVQKGERVGELYAVYVLESFQRKGIGRELIRLAQAKLHEHRVFEVGLWVLKENVNARLAYENLGWTSSDERRTSLAGFPIIEIRYVAPH